VLAIDLTEAPYVESKDTMMPQIALDTEAGQVSTELARRGIAPATRVHVVVEVSDAPEPPMAALAQGGRAFEWLAEEPDLYSDADLLSKRPG
jgi:hypothetical protein